MLFWTLCLVALVRYGRALRSISPPPYAATILGRRTTGGFPTSLHSHHDESIGSTPETSTRVSFPAMKLHALRSIPPGECLISDSFTVHGKYDFCVKLYPNGGGQQQSGFGMAYKLLPNLDMSKSRVGVYLQFLPRDIDQTIDASFALRLKGNQQNGPKFDVEWRAGMRFQTETKLRDAVANDFGAHVMQSRLLQEFLGVSDTDTVSMQVEVEVQVFEASHRSPKNHAFWQDVRTDHALRVANVVVPVLRSLKERPNMMAQGVYPGVEYRILRILDENDTDVFYHKPGVSYEMRPIYPLVAALERPWPIQIHESDIPKLVTPNAYNAVSALGSLATAVLGLAVSFWLSSAVSFFYIPSRSMEPTLQIGDVLLVEKVRMGELHRRDIVLFQPPSALQDIVAANGGRLNPRDLFVKRVAGLPLDAYNIQARSGMVTINGDTVQNQLCQAENGVAKFLPEDRGDQMIPDDSVLVLGDCGNVSVDSRVWGPLPKNQLVGRPLVRVWPMDRMGPVR